MKSKPKDRPEQLIQALRMSKKQEDVAKLLIEGYRIKKITQKLQISESICHNRIASIFKSLGLTGSFENKIEELESIYNDTEKYIQKVVEENRKQLEQTIYKMPYKPRETLRKLILGKDIKDIAKEALTTQQNISAHIQYAYDKLGILKEVGSGKKINTMRRIGKILYPTIVEYGMGRA